MYVMPLMNALDSGMRAGGSRVQDGTSQDGRVFATNDSARDAPGLFPQNVSASTDVHCSGVRWEWGTVGHGWWVW